MKITLPLPHKALSPNGRSHWAAKAKQAKNARSSAKLTTLSLFRGGVFAQSDDVKHHITATFYFRDRRSFSDDDNLIGSLKAYRDGIADALNVDDKSMTWSSVKQMIDKANPRVEIEINT